MKKGVTLIELLSVIIILAVIALITTPVVLNLVDNAKKNAFKNSAYGVAKAIEYDILASQLAGNNIEREYLFPNSGLELKGKSPSGGTATVDSQGRIEMLIHDGNWCATKFYEDSEIVIKKYSNGQCGEDFVVYFAQPYNTTITNLGVEGIDEITLSLVFYNNVCGLFVGGMEPELYSAVINTDRTIELTSEDDEVIIGVVSEAGTEVTLEYEGQEYVFTFNNEEHDLYYGEPYELEFAPLIQEGIHYAFSFYEDNTIEISLVQRYDYLAGFVGYEELDDVTMEIKDKEIYIDGELVALISMDGTQIMSFDGMITLATNEEESSWLTIDQDYSNSIYSPTIIEGEEFTISGSTINGHTIESITISGTEISINEDGSWNFTTEISEYEYAILVLEIEAQDTNGETTKITKYICIGGIPLELNSGNLHLTNYTGEENEHFVIPETIIGRNGMKFVITSVDGYLFRQLDNVISITIPAIVTYIGDPNDYDTVTSGINLQEFIVAEDNPDYMDVDGVLYNKNMTRLIRYPKGKKDKSYVIPDSISYVNYYDTPLSECTYLESLTIPNTMEYFSYSELGLDSCTSLKEVNVSNNHPTYTSVDGVLYSKDMTALVYFPIAKDTFTIPSTVTDISSLNNVNIKNFEVESGNSNYVAVDGVLYNKDMTTLIMYPKGKTDTSFTIPSSVTYVSSSAFSGNKNLTSVVIPNGVTNIGSYAFQHCASLTSVTIPGSVNTIGEYAFYNCTGLTNLTIEDGVEVIDEDAFSGCSALTNVVLPSSITTINRYAFSGCDGLTTITIPGGATVANYAFYGCDGLKTILLLDGITKVNANAFKDCVNIESITIPASVTSISSDGINSMTKLKNIIIDENNPNYASLNGVLYNKNMTALIYYPKGKTKASFIIPDSVTTIMDSAFYDSKTLTSITIPNSVKTIGNYAFSGTGLTDIVIPSSVESIGNYAFSNCKNLNSITISNGVKTIGENTFYNCSSLTSITIPDTVEILPVNALYYCVNLSEIIVSENNQNFSSVDGVLYNKDGSSLLLYPRAKENTTFTIPNKVTIIGDYAFSECKNLTNITIPSGLSVIGSYAFNNCTGITNITIPGGVITIGNNAFNNSGLKTVVVEEGVTEIGNYAFSNAYNLTSIDLPDTLNIIGARAFYNTNLKNVTIPNNVTEIGDYAFYSTNLSTITIPIGVNTIGNGAFNDCANLTTVVLHEGLKAIGSYAFSDCSRLTSLVIPSTVEIIGASAFNECTSLETVTLQDGLKTIGSSAFYGCTSLTSITIPGSVTTLDSEIFWNCINLNRVVIEEGVTIIGTWMFDNCIRLTEVVIPKTVTVINSYAFYGCDYLNVYYKGTESEWNSINIKENNEDLTSANKIYNYAS